MRREHAGGAKLSLAMGHLTGAVGFAARRRSFGAATAARILVAAGLLILSGPASALITVESLERMTPRDLALYITGCGVTIADVRFVGAEAAAGTFTSSNVDTIGFSSGMVLTTGAARNVIGPNQLTGASASNGVAGAPDLDALSGKTTYDATILEFDFIPDQSTTTINFDYALASEEYNEWANSSFNDVFAFFLNGKNEALLPGSTTAVSINNVNGGNPFGSGAVNGSYYQCNAMECCTPLLVSCDLTRYADLEMDGITVVFTVTATVSPGVINRMRFAIADGTDSALDTAVFIRSGSFGANCGTATTTTTASTTVPVPLAPYVHGYPNPFRPGSAGAFDSRFVTLRSVPVGGKVDIYSLSGRKTVTVVDHDGDGLILWNGRNAEGREVESGVYLLVARDRSRVVSRGRLVVVR